jgi:hypothetical protein
MSDPVELSESLSTQIGLQVDALSTWLNSDAAKEFGPCTKPVVPDPTFALLPAGVVQVVVGHFLARACRNHKAIASLCGQSLAIEAQPVLRASIESAIDLRYIATNPQVLCTKWALFENVWRFRNSRDSSEESRPPDYGYLSKDIEKRLRQLNRHRPKAKSWRRQDLYRDWDLSSVRIRDQLAAAVWDDKQSMYDFYRLLSDIQHGNSMSIRDYLLPTADTYVVGHDLPNRKAVFVQVLALHAMWLVVCAARHCGASVEQDLFEVALESLGYTPKQLTAAAVNDFRLPSLPG